MVAFYMDENVDADITDGLRKRGVDVLTVQDDGKTGICDPEVMHRAEELGRVVFTNDDDLLVEANVRQQSGIPFAGVIYIHKRNLTVGQCVEDLQLIAEATEVADHLNHVQYLPL